MTPEENLLTAAGNPIENINSAAKIKRIKINYWVVLLIVVGLFLFIQTVQLSLIKAKINQGSFNVGASATSASSNNNLPNMAGGC